jgi:hypothetical protein
MPCEPPVTITVFDTLAISGSPFYPRFQLPISNRSYFAFRASKIITLPAERFASHASVLSFVAGDGARKGETGFNAIGGYLKRYERCGFAAA